MRAEQPWRTNRARVLRSKPVLAEAKLWEHLRNRQLGDHKFVRQMPIGPYFADFVCRERKVIVEVDGGTHSTDDEVLQDAKRTLELQALDYRIFASTMTMSITTSTARSTPCWPSSRKAVDGPEPFAAPHPIPLPVALGSLWLGHTCGWPEGSGERE
jgi:very-short-patch-repair endonuclease